MKQVIQYGRSVWLHLSCPHCTKWFAVEDDIPHNPYCPHCGEQMALPDQEPEQGELF